VGTMAADVLHIQFHVAYAVSTAVFAVTLAVVFVAWNRTEGTLSVHSIVTPRRELFYWAAVMATFALGTAAGDLTANTFGLGYPTSALLFGALIARTGRRVPVVPPERHPRLLDGLRPDPSPRSIHRRLTREAHEREWTGVGGRGGQPAVRPAHRACVATMMRSDGTVGRNATGA